MEETITFELIRKIQLEEQKSAMLTRLPTNFFNAILNYLEQKRKLVSDDDRRNSLELKNIERLVEDVFNRRERKIINIAIINARSGLPAENLSEEERPFYNSIVSVIKTRRNDTLKNLLTGKIAEPVPMVVFKEDTPAFLGIDEQTYGPFKKGDTVRIPEENMKVLLERGIVEEIK
ncbi:MAG: DNA replication complex GINS family protein [Candidatus Aenigmarchaeota archaeon]|nr:DNA replication complex GINS family protein [Candidatus Aenigmarchaeota archaeon]